MNICITMATMRWQNWPRWREQLEAIQAAADSRRSALDARPFRLFWLPVVYPREVAEAGATERELLFGHQVPRWIQPLVIQEEPGVLHCMRKQNAALDKLEQIGFEGWLSAWSDDNLPPRNLGRWLLDSARRGGTRSTASPASFRSFRDDVEVVPPRVIVFSHKRGQRPEPANGIAYETSDLIAAPSEMRIGYVSGEQYFVHTSRLFNLEVLHPFRPGAEFYTASFRYPHHGCCDGALIEWLWRQCPEEFCFVPDKFTPFNGLQPGRWDEDKLQEVLDAE